MGLRYRKSLPLVPGVRLNVTGKGLSSASFGKPGATLNMGRRGTRSTVGIPGSGVSYSSGGGKSALLPGLIIAGLVALFYYAARGSRAAQVTLLLIGLAGVGLIAAGRHPDSAPADTKTIYPQLSTPPKETLPAPDAEAQVAATRETAQDREALSTTEPTGPVNPPAAAESHPMRSPASPAGAGPFVISSSMSAEQSVVVLKTANVRSAPSLSGAILVQLPAGAAVSVVDISGRWAKVRQGDEVLGWISRKLLDDSSKLSPSSAYSQ